jgi:hypothetical protein
MENFNFPLKSVYNDLWIKELKARTYAEDLMFPKANDLSWPQCVTVQHEYDIFYFRLLKWTVQKFTWHLNTLCCVIFTSSQVRQFGIVMKTVHEVQLEFFNCCFCDAETMPGNK